MAAAHPPKKLHTDTVTVYVLPGSIISFGITKYESEALYDERTLVIASCADELLGKIPTEIVLLAHGLPPDPELDWSLSRMSLHALTLLAVDKVMAGVSGIVGAVTVVF